MHQYCVVYLSPGGIHYRYRCIADTAQQARTECHKVMGVSYKNIVEVYRED